MKKYIQPAVQSHELLSAENILTSASVVQVNSFSEQETTTLGGDDSDE